MRVSLEAGHEPTNTPQMFFRRLSLGLSLVRHYQIGRLFSPESFSHSEAAEQPTHSRRIFCARAAF
jgi:hypothetical protein